MIKTKDKRPKTQENLLLGEPVPRSFSEAGGKGWVKERPKTQDPRQKTKDPRPKTKDKRKNNLQEYVITRNRFRKLICQSFSN
jgi:hypothetical protein